MIPFRSYMRPSGRLSLYFDGGTEYWETATRVKITGNPEENVNAEFDISGIQFLVNGTNSMPSGTVVVYTKPYFSDNHVARYNGQFTGSSTNNNNSGFEVVKVSGGPSSVSLNNLTYNDGTPTVTDHPLPALPPVLVGGNEKLPIGDRQEPEPDPHFDPRIPKDDGFVMPTWGWAAIGGFILALLYLYLKWKL